MVIRSISEAKAELSALIAMVQKGDEVILSKSGKPVAKIVFNLPRQVLLNLAGELRILPACDRTDGKAF